MPFFGMVPVRDPRTSLLLHLEASRSHAAEGKGGLPGARLRSLRGPSAFSHGRAQREGHQEVRSRNGKSPEEGICVHSPLVPWAAAKRSCRAAAGSSEASDASAAAKAPPSSRASCFARLRSSDVREAAAQRCSLAS